MLDGLLLFMIAALHLHIYFLAKRIEKLENEAKTVSAKSSR